MFFVLEGLPEEKRSKGRVLIRRRSAEIVCTKSRVNNSLPYYIVSTPLNKGKIPWGRIEKMFQPFYPLALLPFGTTLPEGSGFKPFESRCLSQWALLDGAVDFFLRRHEKKASLLLFDEKGLLAERTEKLVQIFQYVCVISENLVLYEAVRRRLFEKFGLSIVIAQRVAQNMFDADVIISKCAGNIPATFNGEVFCLEKGKTLSSAFHFSSCTDAPSYVKNSLPNGISELDFTAALYEKCNLKELKEVKLIF